jgi:hypothetical protein
MFAAVETVGRCTPGKTLILVKRSEDLSILFSERSWVFHGPVDYRVSHGEIYQRGELTTWTDEDLLDTGVTAHSPRLLPSVAWSCD